MELQKFHSLEKWKTDKTHWYDIEPVSEGDWPGIISDRQPYYIAISPVHILI